MDYLFWLSTLIPGFAVLNLSFAGDLRSGVLGILSWSFVLTMALITPIVVVAHVFNFTMLPVVIFYLTLVLLGAAGISISFRWGDVRDLTDATYSTALAIVGVVIASTASIGTGLLYDHQMHVAKILYLRDIGFSLQDPYSPLEVAAAAFLVNTYYAIHAIGGYLSGKEPLEFWERSAWFFRLLALGGIEFLTLAIFQNRWSGTIAILGALWIMAVRGGVVIPQEVGAYIVFPLLLAHVVEFLDERKKTVVIKIAVASLSLSVIHVGYWLIVTIVLIPTLLAWNVWNYRQPESVSLVSWAIGGILVGIPFLLITAMQPNHVMEQMGNLFLWETSTFAITKSLTLHFMRPNDHAWMLLTAMMLVLLLILQKRKSSGSIVLAGVFFSACLYMFNPLIYEILMNLIPYWIINRMRYVGEIVALVAIPGGFAWMLRRTLQTKATRIVFALMVFCGGLALFKPIISRNYRWSEDGRIVLERAAEMRQTLRPIVRNRSLILADPEMSLFIPAVQISSVMAPCLGNANPADEYVVERYRDAREYLDPETSMQRRREIVSTYNIDFVLLTKWNKPEPSFGCFYRNGQVTHLRGIGDLVAERDWFQLFKVRY
jgi:hypothetical protein